MNLQHRIVLNTAEVLKHIPVVSGRQLQIWDESALIPAHRKYGHKRIYTEEQLFQILLHVEAVASGAGVQHLHRMWASLVSRPAFTTSDYLILSEKSFCLVEDRSELPAALAALCKRHKRPCAFVDMRGIREVIDRIVHDVRARHGYHKAA
jgi:DNA-binding transcriptional MerR regulator